MSKVVISRGGQNIFLLEGGHKKLKQRGSGGSHAKKIYGCFGPLWPGTGAGVSRRNFFFWGKFFYAFSKKKKNAASSKSYRGSKAISEGVGVIWILEGGHTNFFRRGRTPLTPPLLTYGLNFLQVRSVIYYYAVSCAAGMKRFAKQFKSNGTYLSILRTTSSPADKKYGSTLPTN